MFCLLVIVSFGLAPGDPALGRIRSRGPCGDNHTMPVILQRWPAAPDLSPPGAKLDASRKKFVITITESQQVIFHNVGAPAFRYSSSQWIRRADRSRGGRLDEVEEAGDVPMVQRT
jgi:hypothetical protein